MPITWTGQGLNISVGVESSDLELILCRKYLWRKWAKVDPSLTGKVGTTIQFTKQFEPRTVMPGFGDIPDVPLRDPLYVPRTINLLTYGEGREWNTGAVLRGQVNLEEKIKGGLTDTVARDINAACGATWRTANCIYTPTGALGAETVGIAYNGTVTGGLYSRLLNEWDLAELANTAAGLGMKPGRSGFNLVVERINKTAFFRRMIVYAVAGPPKSLETVLKDWEGGEYIGWMHGTNIWYDSSQDVLSSACVGAGLGPWGEAMFFGETPVTEANLGQGIQTGTETADAGRKLRLKMWEEGIGWTLNTNVAGGGLAGLPPADLGAQSVIRIFDT